MINTVYNYSEVSLDSSQPDLIAKLSNYCAHVQWDVNCI